MSTTRTRRTITAIVVVWILGLLLVLAMWQRVDAACGEGGQAPATAVDCVTVPGVEQAVAPSPRNG
ncbi:MAG: hypothetical protein WEB09_04965 [Nitriliruptor sp.]